MQPQPICLVFEFHQTVSAMCRETDETPPQQETYARSGILLMRQEIQPDRVVSEFQEYELDAQTLKALHAGQRFARTELEAMHQQALDQRALEFGLAGPLAVTSARDYFNLYLQGGDYLRFDLIYLPTVLQHAPADSQTWPPIPLSLRAGPGVYPIQYTTRRLVSKSRDIYLNADLVEQPAVVQVGAFELSLRPQGRIEHTLSSDDHLPVTSKGRYRIRINAKGEKLSGDPVQVDVIDYQVAFDLQRVDIGFDREQVGWQAVD